MTVLTGCVLLFISVMMLAWSLLKLVVTGVIGIGPGDTRGPLIRNALTALASLLYVGTSTIVLAVVLVLIKNAFATDVGNPMSRFLLVDVILIGGLVIVIQTWAAHRRGAQSWTDKAMAKFKQSTPKPTIGSRVGGWLKAPAGGEAAKYGGLGGDSYGYGAGGGGAGSPFGLRRMARPVTHSNAFQLARLGVMAGATGGGAALVAGKATTRVAARVAAHSVTGTVAGARTLASGAATGAHWAGVGVRHTADSAQRVYDTYTAVRAGSQAPPPDPTRPVDHPGRPSARPRPPRRGRGGRRRRTGPGPDPHPSAAARDPHDGSAPHRGRPAHRTAHRRRHKLTRPAAPASAAVPPTHRTTPPPTTRRRPPPTGRPLNIPRSPWSQPQPPLNVFSSSCGQSRETAAARHGPAHAAVSAVSTRTKAIAAALALALLAALAAVSCGPSIAFLASLAAQQQCTTDGGSPPPATPSPCPPATRTPSSRSGPPRGTC